MLRFMSFSRAMSAVLIPIVGGLEISCTEMVPYPTQVYGFASDCEQESYGLISHDTHPHLAGKRWNIEVQKPLPNESFVEISPDTPDSATPGVLPIVQVGRYRCDFFAVQPSTLRVYEAICTTQAENGAGAAETCRMRLNSQGFRSSPLDVGTSREGQEIGPFGVDEINPTPPYALFSGSLQEISAHDEEGVEKARARPRE